MNRSTENTAYLLNRIILVIAVGFLFFLKSEKINYNHDTDYKQVTTVELKANLQAIPAISSEIPTISWVALFNPQNTNPCFKSSLEISLKYSISKSLDECFSKYLNAKPVIERPFKRQLLSRYPDTAYPSLS